MRFKVETESLRYNLPKNSELLSLPVLSWPITHQHQDCISRKQGRRVEETEKHSNIGNDQQFEDTGRRSGTQMEHWNV